MSTALHPVDNSALIHLAVHNKWHSNVFRLEVHLASGVRPAHLQQAADTVAARFPMLAAGIRKQKNQFVVVPCPENLYIRVDEQPLAYMSTPEIEVCAMRILYGQRHIAVEFFHSLTDGTGGLRFLNALLAEYFYAPTGEFPLRDAWEDSYQRYASGKPTALPGGPSWLLPPAPLEIRSIHRITLLFSVQELRQKTTVPLTAFFTTLFAQTAMELQQAQSDPDKPLLPVQVMVPIDLRKRFPSSSLRNFSLYALPVLFPEATAAPLEELTENIVTQIKTQSAYSRLQAAITTNVELERRTAARPLWAKCTALKAGFEVCGGRSSCITVSNLGQVTFPEPVQQQIQRLEFLLTPRAHSPYNCGIVSVGDTLCLTITRRGKSAGFEKNFVAGLVQLGIVPTVAEEEC